MSGFDLRQAQVVVVAALATSAGHCSEKHRPETPDCLESEPEHEPPVRSGRAVARFGLRMAVALARAPGCAAQAVGRKTVQTVGSVPSAVAHCPFHADSADSSISRM